jgi:hypothetical protein
MPIGVILVLTFAIMAIRRGVDWPLAVTAAALGDRSNGTILEGPIDMIGNLWDQLWGVAVQVFSRSGSTPNALMHTSLHVAQMTGVAA